MTNKISIYIHWPFCKAKCPYCDFNSHVRGVIDHKQWLSAYLNEIDKFSENIAGREIKSIFFGGGTPSLMAPTTVGGIINKLSQIGSFADDIEITLEANPTSFEAAKFKDFKRAGINRVSLGIQSLNDDDLRFLGREHSSNEAINTIRSAATIFDNYSFDLIYTRPNQTLKLWEEELVNALKLARDHISIYQLTIEKGTKFYSMYNKGEFILPNDNDSYSLYELSRQILEDAGYQRYEISNYAKNGRQSVHNLCYWNYDDYLGIGPGSHSRIANNAIYQIYNPENWQERALSSDKANQKLESLSSKEIFNEILIMGLRLTDGVKFSKLQEKLGNYDNYLNKTKLTMLEQNHLILIDQKGFRATSDGMMRVNKIIEFLSL